MLFICVILLANIIEWKEGPAGTSDAKEEYRDDLLGGFAIILLGILLSASSVWGIVDNVYSVSGGAGFVLFFILGVGTILIGVSILLRKPVAKTVAV